MTIHHQWKWSFHNQKMCAFIFSENFHLLSPHLALINKISLPPNREVWGGGESSKLVLLYSLFVAPTVLVRYNSKSQVWPWWLPHVASYSKYYIKYYLFHQSWALIQWREQQCNATIRLFVFDVNKVQMCSSCKLYYKMLFSPKIKLSVWFFNKGTWL